MKMKPTLFHIKNRRILKKRGERNEKKIPKSKENSLYKYFSNPTGNHRVLPMTVNIRECKFEKKWNFFVALDTRSYTSHKRRPKTKGYRGLFIYKMYQFCWPVRWISIFIGRLRKKGETEKKRREKQKERERVGWKGKHPV